MKRKRIQTDDGSHSFYVAELKEHYHSVHGAIQESMHVFIEAGLHDMKPGQELNILEVGFGTGLNALLTIAANEKRGHRISYETLEAYPLTMMEIRDLNYCDELGLPALHAAFLRMHDCNWGSPTPVYRNFILTKIRGKLERFIPKPGKYDLVYFDAFAPRVQPEMWSEEVFSSLFKGMRKGSVLVTYCAKGSVKRALRTAGFDVESPPGPKGKREMTRAVKP